MSITARREQHKVELRRLILDTAERLFVQAGSYDAVSMRKIAKEINYSATTIYLYFKDKDALFQTLLRETFRQLSRTVAMAVTDRDPVAGLFQAMKSYVTFGLEHPEHYRLLFIVRPSLATSHQAARQIGDEAFNLLHHQVGLCISRGRFAGSDQETISQGGWAVVHGLTSMLLNQPGLKQQRLTDHVLGNYLRGLLASSAPSGSPKTL